MFCGKILIKNNSNENANLKSVSFYHIICYTYIGGVLLNEKFRVKKINRW